MAAFSCLPRAMAAWGTWSVFEEAILSAFKTDYEKKLLELSGSGKLLDAAEVGKMLDQEAVKYNRAEANASPAPPYCSVDGALTTIRQFIKDRPAAVASRIKG